MKLQEQQGHFARDVAKLITFIFNERYSCTLGEAFRTKEQAEIYVKQGIGILNSLHCERLAIDLHLFSPEEIYLDKTDDYKKFGLYWESLDSMNRWGGRFKKPDGCHFERIPLE